MLKDSWVKILRELEDSQLLIKRIPWTLHQDLSLKDLETNADSSIRHFWGRWLKFWTWFKV